MRQLELKVPPLALVLVCAVGIALLGRFVPAANVPFPGHRALAAVAVLAGIAFSVAGIVQFRAARTTVNPMSPDRASAVVTSGVYRLTRNPMYLGMALILAGLAFWWASGPGLLLVAAYGAYMTQFQIKPEERALETVFGAAYRAYRARVRRWI